jgi:hypothetical protein
MHPFFLWSYVMIISFELICIVHGKIGFSNFTVIFFPSNISWQRYHIFTHVHVMNYSCKGLTYFWLIIDRHLRSSFIFDDIIEWSQSFFQLNAFLNHFLILELINDVANLSRKLLMCPELFQWHSNICHPTILSAMSSLPIHCFSK